MGKLVHSKCPNCGAGIDVDPDATQATCTYCGNTAQLARKTLFGAKAMPLNLAATGAKVIHIPHARRMVFSMVMIFVFIAIFGIAIMLVIRSITNKATEMTRSHVRTSTSKQSVDMEINNGNTRITIKNGKVVGGTVGGMPIPVPTEKKAPAGFDLYSQPVMAKAKFLAAAGGDAKVAGLVLRRHRASLKVLDDKGIVYYSLRGGEVEQPSREKASKARLRKARKYSYSLASLSLAPTQTVVADAKKRLSGNNPEVAYIVIEKKRKGLQWQVFAKSDSDRKVIRYDASGKFKSAR